MEPTDDVATLYKLVDSYVELLKIKEDHITELKATITEYEKLIINLDHFIMHQDQQIQSLTHGINK